MKQDFIIKNDNSSLLLVFGGWGTWTGLFSEGPFPEGYDVLLCYDYRTMDFDPSALSGYGTVRLIAWSMGVWVASRVLAGADVRWEKRIAVNGTLTPVDDLTGIPVAVFNGTLDNMSGPVLSKFNRRMCGKDLACYMSRGQDRSAEELKEELSALKEAVGASGVALSFMWDVAVVGTKDLIFPAENQLRAWDVCAVEAVKVDCAHYSRDLFARLFSSCCHSDLAEQAEKSV